MNALHTGALLSEHSMLLHISSIPMGSKVFHFFMLDLYPEDIKQLLRKLSRTN